MPKKGTLMTLQFNTSESVTSVTGDVEPAPQPTDQVLLASGKLAAISTLPGGTGGTPGPVGPAGPAGPAGPQGDAGPEGPQGPTGPTGATGAPGPQGVQGAQGPAGADGLAGVAGATGPAGPPGATGPAGAAGAPGAPGDDGADGDDGPAGPAGPQGPQGPAGTNGDPRLKVMTANGPMTGPAVKVTGATALTLTDPNTNNIQYIWNADPALTVTLSAPGGGGGGIPTFVGVGTLGQGSAGTTTPAVAGYPTSLAGDILHLQLAHANNITSMDDTFALSDSGWTLIFTDNQSNQRQFIYRKTSPGTSPSTTPVTVTRTGDGTVGFTAAIWAFRGVSGAEEAPSFSGSTSSASVLDAGVTTTSPDRLVVNFGCLNTNQPAEEFIGETGGTWVLRGSLAGAPALFCQTADKAVAGTVDGGSDAITAVAWQVRGFALAGSGAGGVTILGSNTIAPDTVARIISVDNGINPVAQVQRLP